MSSKDCVTCPHCGEEIARKAKACPYCGSDESTGWSEGTYLDGIDLSDDESYKEAHANEFGSDVQWWRQRLWIVVTAVVILAIFIAGAFSIFR
jgi:hypothetical protein